MKKLIVLLLAFAAIGAVFAQTPTLSAYSTLSFGVDFDTMRFGFKNTNSATFKVPFVLGNQAKKGDKGWWGEIAVNNLTFQLQDDALATGATPTTDTVVFKDWDDKDSDGVKDTGEYATLTAKITNGVWSVSVSSKDSFDYSNADDIYDGEVNVALDADTAGTTISYSANGLTFGVTGASKGDWTTNASNEFSLGAKVGYKFSDALSIAGAVAYDMFDASKQLGATAAVDLTLTPLTVNVDADLSYATVFDADAKLDIGYAVMEGLDVFTDVFYSTLDDGLEFQLGADYALDAAEAGVWFGMEDALTDKIFDLGVYAGYTFNVADKTTLYVYGEYTNDLTGAKGALVPYAILTNTSITNTKITLEYNADELDVLAGTYGTLIAAAKVSL
jgi:hypothetical protein